MRALLLSLWLTCALALPVATQTDGGRRFDEPPPKAARDLVKRAADLAGRDRIAEATTTLKKAIAVAPNYLEAHREYIRVKSDFQGKTDEVKVEYETLMAKNPNHPVYPMAMAMSTNKIEWYKRVADLAPEWSWGRYAKAYVLLGRTHFMINEKLGDKGEQMLAELHKALEKDGTVRDFYELTIFLQTQLDRIDDAIQTAEKMSMQPGLYADGLGQLWRLRLSKARGVKQAKEGLKAELTKLSTGARDIKLLTAIRDAYISLLDDPSGAAAVERRISRIDPAWYPERGKAQVFVTFNSSGIPYAIHAANRQYAIYQKVRQIITRREPDRRGEMRRLESLLAFGPNLGLKKLIYGVLFTRARELGFVSAMIRYGERLHALDASDNAPFAKIALTLADKKTALPKALDYARRAGAALAVFHPLDAHAGIPADAFRSNFSLEKQRDNYRRQRALTLDAWGWVLLRMGRHKEAEPLLRQAVALNRSEASLIHLVEALRQLGHLAEAEKIVSEIDSDILASVKREFINEPAKDFQLEAIDGRRYRLSALKGKVVLVNFWATWCGPCVAEMNVLGKVYEKYKDKGLEILAVSGDDPAERDRVVRFAMERQLRFPVLFDDGIAKLYGVIGFPSNVFIDRQGNIRYYHNAAFDVGGQRLEIILKELLK